MTSPNVCAPQAVRLAAEPDILAALTPVVEALEDLGIAYRIGGSVASSVHGTPRATNDVDLVADIRMEHVEPLCARLRSSYYADPNLLQSAVETPLVLQLHSLRNRLQGRCLRAEAEPVRRPGIRAINPATAGRR